MTNPSLHPLELILRQCLHAGASPWYPSSYAREANVPRDSLDPYLDLLRLGGLIRLTDWVHGKGQGYVLTPEGRLVLDSPQALARLRTGQLAPPEESKLPPAGTEQRGQTSWERGEAVRDALFTPQEPLLVRLLVGATVCWFIFGMILAAKQDVSTNTYLFPAEAVDGRPADLQGKLRERHALASVHHTLGAVRGSALFTGEWWRLLSYAFVHSGLLHIGLNMYGLFMLGRLGEQMWGSLRFLLLYLISALGGSVLALHYNPEVSLVGASGSVCGILAGTSVWVWLNRSHLPPLAVSAWMRNLVINLVLITIISLRPHVSAAGHVGGAVLGGLLGGLFSFHRFGTPLQRWLSAGGVLACVGLCAGFLAWSVQTNPQWQGLRDRVARAGDTQEFINQYVPLAQAVEAEVATYYRTALYPLLTRPPTERDPQEVEQAVAYLGQLRSRLLDTARRLEREAGPYHEVDTDQARLIFARQLAIRAAWVDLLGDRLQKGSNWSLTDVAGLEAKRRLATELDALSRLQLRRIRQQAPVPLPEKNDAAGGSLYTHPLAGT